MLNQTTGSAGGHDCKIRGGLLHLWLVFPFETTLKTFKKGVIPIKSKLVINGTFLMKSVTGVQRFAIEIINALGSLNYDFIILAPNEYQSDQLFGYKVVRDSIPFPWRNQWWLWEQIRLPRLYYNNFSSSLLWSPTNTGPLRVKNQIVTIHDAAVFAGPEWFSFFGRTYYQWLIPRLAKKVKHIITVSEFSKSELIKYGLTSSERISVVPNGVKFDLIEKTSYINHEQDKNYIINVGTRDPRKNVKRLISAWNKINVDIKAGKELIIIGGFNKGFSSENLNTNKKNDVKILGYLQDKEIIELYKKSLFSVYPSLYEGFGLPPLEAMACGVPVLVSKVASLPEVCGSAALYCNPYDEEDIKDKMILLLTNQNLRNDLSKRGLDQIRKFSWKSSAEKFINIVEKLIK